MFDQLLKIIASEGVGYALFALAVVGLGAIIVFQQKRIDAKDKELRELSDKRVEDNVKSRDLLISTINSIKDALIENGNSTKQLADKTYDIVTNMQHLLQNWKG